MYFCEAEKLEYLKMYNQIEWLLVPKYDGVQIKRIFYNAGGGSSCPEDVLLGRKEIRLFDTV